MGRGNGSRLWLRLAPIAASLAVGSAAPCAGESATNVRLVNNTHRFAMTLALDGAARLLDRPECQLLLDEFKGSSGQSLRGPLEALGMGAPEYLRAGLFFYDAPERVCGTSNVAVTRPGSRAVLICGARFVREMRDSRKVEAVLIHEMLHSLGLGENPPSSDEITARVRARCGQGGPPPVGVRVADRP